MNNIEWKEGAVCYADNYQWAVSDDGHLVDASGGGNLDYIERVIRELDFQLNEPRIGDYLPKSELDTEQKYNDAVEVFGLFGVKCYEGNAFSKLNNWFGVIIDDDNVLVFGNKAGCEIGRKLTYNQLMAIGKLKRLMMEREATKEHPKINHCDVNQAECVITESISIPFEVADSSDLPDVPEVTFQATPLLEAPKTSTEFLQACIDVQSERGKQYDSSGTGERSFDAAAKAYNALTGGNLRGSDVCLLLTCVKAVRQYSNPERIHDDSLLDMVSYAALWAEELNKELK